MRGTPGDEYIWITLGVIIVDVFPGVFLLELSVIINNKIYQISLIFTIYVQRNINIPYENQNENFVKVQMFS